MGYLCRSAVVKFKTHIDDNWQRNYGYCDSRSHETQMTEKKYAAEMFKWDLWMSKSDAVMSMEMERDSLWINKKKWLKLDVKYASSCIVHSLV